MKKIKTRNIKVLPLDRWMSCDEDIEEEIKELDLRETLPVFKKPGWYVFGKACWFETPLGKAYHYSIEQFKHELSLYEVSKYNHKQINALKEFINQGLATKKQKELYYLIRHYYQCKEVGRSAMKIRIRFDNIDKKKKYLAEDA